MLKSLIAVLGLFICLSVTFAAAKYAAPAIPANKVCVITNKAAKFTMSRDAINKIDLAGEGAYNYDDTWDFKLVSAVPQWLDGGGGIVLGPGVAILSEAGLPTPGEWTLTTKIADLPNGTTVELRAQIRVEKAQPPIGKIPVPPLLESAVDPQSKIVPNRN